jgi:pyruvate,orthophosphate dikinase
LAPAQALQTIDAGSLEALLHPVFDPSVEFTPLTKGVAASPGAAKGAIALSADDAIERAASGESVILVRQFTEADDVAGFHAASGILTSAGGKASHAALVARGMGRPCVAGASEVVVDEQAQAIRVNSTELEPGDQIAIDGSTGTVTVDDVPLVEPEIGDDFRSVLEWADELREVGVRANADLARDAARARTFGAEGIGLCRTEHMFFGEDRGELVRQMFIAAEQQRRARVQARADSGGGNRENLAAAESHFLDALQRLEELQRRDFKAILHEMHGMPVTIRLLDPPLHEFLPPEHYETQVRELEEGGDAAELEEARQTAALVSELQQANPMLGTRGVRLGILYPQIYEMQTRAVIAAAAESSQAGDAPHVEIMLPLVAYEAELELLRETVIEAADKAKQDAGVDVRYSVGTMIELPRACLVADRIAEHADFFSFGTNDLTQTTIGFSRDDIENSFMPAYLEQRIVDRSPFETIDMPGVGELVRMGVERGRRAKDGLTCGVCGEHGGEPDSVRFFAEIGLDYVSCSPYRVPIARVAAAQAAISNADQ